MEEELREAVLTLKSKLIKKKKKTNQIKQGFRGQLLIVFREIQISLNLTFVCMFTVKERSGSANKMKFKFN